MAGETDQNLQLSSDFTAQQYSPPVPAIPTNIVNLGATTVVTTINGGGGGQATGPAITFNSAWSGVDYTATAGNVTLTIVNAANARAALGAAKSGVNTDITQLNGASQVDVSGEYKVSGAQVVTARQPAIPDAILGTEVATINLILAAMRIHGLIAP
jgi:hypothetical protein